VGEPAPALPAIPDSDKDRVVSIRFPSSQAHVYVGQVGIRRGDPDYYSLFLGNQVLGGGGLVSMLSSEVREARGLSYSVYSYFLPMREAGPFLVGLQTRTDQVNEAVQVAEDTLGEFVTNGPDPVLLEAARQNIVGGFPLRIDNNSKMTKYLAVIGFYGLPLDYLQTFPATIEALSRDDVADAFKRRVHPDRLTTVIVGNGSS
jgi:zinc protease